MRRLRKIALVIGIVLIVVLVAGTAWGVVTVRSSFPTTEGTTTVEGLEAPVEVRRDAYGIPTITADNVEDLFFAQGYVHAQDRFWEMDFRRHVTAGRLSELFGASQVETDAFIRTLGWRRVAEAELELLEPETITYLESYAGGVNAYLAERQGAALSLEYAILGLQNGDYRIEPWTPADSVAWLKAMAWDLRGNMGREMERTLLATVLPRDRIEELYPPYPFGEHPTIVESDAAGASAPSTVAASIDWTDAAAALTRVAERAAGLPAPFGRGEGIGSNAFAVAGSRTASGMPLLANDPHLAPGMPSIWTQVGLRCRVVSEACPFDVSGFSFSGMPGVIIGHNARIAWGLTNMGPDVTDLYLERLEGDAAIVDGAAEPLTTREEVITVAGGDPVTITVRATRHGPIISDVSEAFGDLGIAAGSADEPYAISLAWTALSPGTTMDAVFGLNAAGDFDAFRAAAARFEVPAQNLVYADVDGHIGYQAPGRIPIRRAGDGAWPAAGWDSRNDWAGFIPFEELPWELDPPSGMVVTANQAVIGPSYPYHLTDDFDLGYRAARITELLERAGPLDVASMGAMALDTREPFAATLLPYLDAVAIDDPAVNAARDLLDGWDGSQPSGSTAAPMYAATWRALLARTFHDEVSTLAPEQQEDLFPGGGDRWFAVLGRLLEEPDDPWWDDVTTPAAESRDDILRAALEDANAELHATLGDDLGSWRWGRLHRLELRNATFGESGIGPIEWLFNRGPFELAGGEDAVDAIGWNAPDGYAVDWLPSMRMVVDLSDLDASRWVNLTGASGHAFHAHYEDQAPLWATGETTPWRFTPAALDAATEDLLTLTPPEA